MRISDWSSDVCSSDLRVADGDIRFVTAESCTGGQLAAALAGHSTLGSHLERGYIVYSVDAKCEMLGISRALAERSQGVGASVTAAQTGRASCRESVVHNV